MHKVCFLCFCSWSRKSCYGSTPSGTMVESAMRDVNTANPTAILPQPNLMQRHINRQRQETRPGHDDAGLQPGLVPHTGGLSCGRRQWRSQAPSRLRHQSLTIPAFPSCSLVPGRHLQNHQETLHPALWHTRLGPTGWLHEARAARLRHYEPEDDTRLCICAAHYRRSPPSPTSRYHSDHRLWARSMAGRVGYFIEWTWGGADSSGCRQWRDTSEKRGWWQHTQATWGHCGTSLFSCWHSLTSRLPR